MDDDEHKRIVLIAGNMPMARAALAAMIVQKVAAFATDALGPEVPIDAYVDPQEKAIRELNEMAEAIKVMEPEPEIYEFPTRSRERDWEVSGKRRRPRRKGRK